MNNALLVVLFNSLLLASGILILLISCLQYGNWYPMLTIVANLIAVLQLMMCGSCNGDTSMDSLFGEVDGRTIAVQISWMLFGLLVIMGYCIPSLLYRAQLVPDVALYFSYAGGTVIISSMLIYLKLIWNRE